MLVFMFVACDATLTHIAVTGSASSTIAGGSILEDLVGDLGFSDFVSMDLTQDQALANQGVKPEDISSAVLTDFGLEAVSGSPDLAFINSMELSVETETLPSLTIARSEDFPANEPIVDFSTTGADIQEYVTSRAMTLTTDVDAHHPDDDTVVRATWTVDVGVTTQGAVSNL